MSIFKVTCNENVGSMITETINWRKHSLETMVI